MAYTPLPPSGVVNALQNIANFPDKRLRQYAAGDPRQPTGQVQPGPTGQAAQELNTRGIQRQAAQNNQAMQNDPSKGPTTFQRIQQKEQELQQREQQLGQREQQLGLLGALMAKKTQDMQARDTAGIGSLPLDTFNKFDGGIVFSGGGAVQRFNGLQGSQPRNRAEANLQELMQQVEMLPDREEVLRGFGGVQPDAYLLRRKLIERGYEIDPKTNEIKTPFKMKGPITQEHRDALLGFGQMYGEAKTKEAALRGEELSKGASPAQKKKEDTGRKDSDKTSTPSVGTSLDIEGRMRRGLASVRGESDQQQRLVSDIQRNLDEQYKAIDESNLTDAQKEAARKKVTDAMQAEYGEYTKGRETRQQAVADALRGKKPGMFAGIASALPSGNASFADVLAGAAKGVTAERGRYRDADKEAALYIARAQEESAKADMLEKRGQRAEAQAAEDRAQALLDKAAIRKTQALDVKKQGLAALLQREDKLQADERAIAEKAITAQLDIESKIMLERLKASLQPREVSFYNQVLAAFNSGDPKRIQAAKDALSAMSLSKPASGAITDSQLRKAYDSEMRTWDIKLKGPMPTYEQWKARSAGPSEGVVDFTGGKG